MPPFQSIKNSIPKVCKNCPIGCLGPTTRINKNPHTVGGKTNGKVNKTSKKPLKIVAFF